MSRFADMNGAPSPERDLPSLVLIVEKDVIARHAIADYLRQCGYAVVEAATTDEAVIVLTDIDLSIDIMLCDVSATGTLNGFELAQWVKSHAPDVQVALAGNVPQAAHTAATLCESGPQLARPYDPQGVVDYIKQLRARRDRRAADDGKVGSG